MGNTWRRDSDSDFKGSRGKREGKRNFQRKDRWSNVENDEMPIPKKGKEHKTEDYSIFS